MIDEQLIRLIHERIHLETIDHTKEIQGRIVEKKGDLAKRGMMHAGPPVIMSFAKACEQAIRERSELCWQTTHRFIAISGARYSESLTDELKGIIAHHLPEHLNNIKCFLERNAHLAGLKKGEQEHILSHAYDQMEMTRQHALKKINTEIDLFVASLKHREEQSSESRESLTNIYTPNTTIQTGPNATFHIVTQSLTQLLAEVNAAPEDEISDQSRKKSMEVIGTAIQDIAKGKVEEAVRQIVELGKEIGPTMTKSAAFAILKMLQGG